MQVSHRRIGGIIGCMTLALGALPLTAQEADPKVEAEITRDIPLEEWRDRALGRTVYYSIGGAPFGREYYAPDGRGVVFQHVDGTCLEGEWTYRAEIAAYCYLWPTSVSCFRHVERDGETLILPVETDGSRSAEPAQSVDRIAPVPLSCGPAVTS